MDGSDRLAVAIEKLVEHLVQDSRERHKEHIVRHDDHENRIRGVESWKQQIVGTAVILLAVVGAVGSIAAATGRYAAVSPAVRP